MSQTQAIILTLAFAGTCRAQEGAGAGGSHDFSPISLRAHADGYGIYTDGAVADSWARSWLQAEMQKAQAEAAAIGVTIQWGSARLIVNQFDGTRWHVMYDISGQGVRKKPSRPSTPQRRSRIGGPPGTGSN